LINMCMTCHGLFKRVFGGNQKMDCFVWSMRFVVLILNLMPLYVMNYEMNEWMENEMDKFLVKVIFNCNVFFTLVSYGVATFKKPKKIP